MSHTLGERILELRAEYLFAAAAMTTPSVSTASKPRSASAAQKSGFRPTSINSASGKSRSSRRIASSRSAGLSSIIRIFIMGFFRIGVAGRDP